MQEVAAAREGARAGAGRRRRRAAAPRSRTLPNPPDPTAADADTSLREVGRDGRLRPRPPRDRRRADRHGGRRARVRLALRLPRRATSCCSSSRSCAGACRCSRGHGFTPVIPPVLVREEALYGTGFLPDTEQQIYTAARRRPVPRRHQRGAAGVAARGRDPRRRARCRCATRASRPASGARRAPPAATRAASSASTSSTSSRCSASSRPTSRATSTSGCWRSRRSCCRRSTSRTAWSTSPSTTSAPRPPRSTTSRRGCRAGTATARSPRPRTRPTSRPRRLEHPLPRAARSHVHTLNGTAVTWRHMIALLENHGRVGAGGAAAVGCARRSCG